MVVVGPSLAALAHEMAHVAEFWLDGVVDYTHAGWSAKGIQSAVSAYVT